MERLKDNRWYGGILSVSRVWQASSVNSQNEPGKKRSPKGLTIKKIEEFDGEKWIKVTTAARCLGTSSSKLAKAVARVQLEFTHMRSAKFLYIKLTDFDRFVSGELKV